MGVKKTKKKRTFTLPLAGTITVGPDLCLVPNCGLSARDPSCARGLCAAHYRTASLAVEAGETSWLAMEISGKCRPAQRPRGAARLWLTGVQ